MEVSKEEKEVSKEEKNELKEFAMLRTAVTNSLNHDINIFKEDNSSKEIAIDYDLTPPPGFAYHFATDEPYRVKELNKKGWNLVPASRYPLYKEFHRDGLIKYKDSVLMERKKELHDKERKLKIALQLGRLPNHKELVFIEDKSEDN